MTEPKPDPDPPGPLDGAACPRSRGSSAVRSTLRRRPLLLALAALVALATCAAGSLADVAGWPRAGAQSSSESPTSAEPTPTDEPALTLFEAAILGVVEGVTEYLPVSSTGHLLLTQEVLGVGSEEGTEDAAESFAISVQLGAILAVLVLYRNRVREMADGLVGRDERGRRLLVAVVAAFTPAAVVALVAEDAIKDVLFGPWTVIAALAAGGVAIILLARFRLDREAAVAKSDDPTPEDDFDPATELETDAGGLSQMTVQQALVIGLAQCLALWPGTSRSLVTIVAAVLVGLKLPAAVEFSFLLGLVTLGAATTYEMLGSGGEMVDVFGLAPVVVGLLTAFASAVAAVRWMVGYLQRHSFAIFGWYRIVLAAVFAVLVGTGTVA